MRFTPRSTRWRSPCNPPRRLLRRPARLSVMHRPLTSLSLKISEAGIVCALSVLLTGVMVGQQIAPNDSHATFPAPKFGSVDTGKTLPHFAAGGDAWRTEFEIFSLEDVPVPFRMEVFDGTGQRQPLELFDLDGRSLGTKDVWTGTAEVGTLRLQTATAGPIRQGYIVFDTPGGSDLAVNAVITNIVGNVPQFRTSVPALGRFQDHIRLAFSNARGFFSGVAYKAEATQSLTIIARRSDGSEICRKTKQIEDNHYEAFLLRDEMPCTDGQEGLIELISDFVGIVAIGLNFDSSLRMWTSLPYEVCCF